MTRKQLTLLAVVALIASVTVPAAALSGSMVDQEVQVDSDTESIRVTAENITNDTADVAIEETVDGNTSEVFTATLDTSNESMDSVEYSELDPNATYRVLVDGDGAASISVKSVEASSGVGVSTSTLSDVQRNALIVLVALFALFAGTWVARDHLDW